MPLVTVLKIATPTGEHRHACRYWPDCEIHRGEPRRTADADRIERAHIACDPRRGTPLGDAHHLTEKQIYRIRRQSAGLRAIAQAGRVPYHLRDQTGGGDWHGACAARLTLPGTVAARCDLENAHPGPHVAPDHAQVWDDTHPHARPDPLRVINNPPPCDAPAGHLAPPAGPGTLPG